MTTLAYRSYVPWQKQYTCMRTMHTLAYAHAARANRQYMCMHTRARAVQRVGQYTCMYTNRINIICRSCWHHSSCAHIHLWHNAQQCTCMHSHAHTPCTAMHTLLAQPCTHSLHSHAHTPCTAMHTLLAQPCTAMHAHTPSTAYAWYTHVSMYPCGAHVVHTCAQVLLCLVIRYTAMPPYASLKIITHEDTHVDPGSSTGGLRCLWQPQGHSFSVALEIIVITCFFIFCFLALQMLIRTPGFFIWTYVRRVIASPRNGASLFSLASLRVWVLGFRV